jgi:hypothetical protein
MSLPRKRKTQVDHWLQASPEEKLRLNRKYYRTAIELRNHEVQARAKMPTAQAWADRFGREPLPEDPDNPYPKGLSYEERAKHSYHSSIEDPDQIRQMQFALTNRRLATEANKEVKLVSKAKMLGNNSEE